MGAAERIITIDFSINPVTDESGKVLQLIPEGRDISELKETREVLAQTNQELEQRVVDRTKLWLNLAIVSSNFIVWQPRIITNSSRIYLTSICKREVGCSI
ncbi:MAG: hypothetical protein AAFV28_14010 [Cyanobacteria bacterium J06635_13]